MNKVTITVSGCVGSGKSALCGEIEILCKALGLNVEWSDGQQEKNLTNADWIEALEMYKPDVTIVEQIAQPVEQTQALTTPIAISTDQIAEIAGKYALGNPRLDALRGFVNEVIIVNEAEYAKSE